MDILLSQFPDFALPSSGYIDRHSSMGSGRRPYRGGKYSETGKMPQKWGLASRSAKRLTGAFTLLTVASAFAPAEAQHTSDNPVASAEDAFGLTLGLESIGLYTPTSVRGFSRQVAGNVRIDGLYFDQQGGLSNRVVEVYSPGFYQFQGPAVLGYLTADF